MVSASILTPIDLPRSYTSTTVAYSKEIVDEVF